MDQEIDIEKIWRGWKIVELIGTGSYGKVYKIIKEDFGHTYVSALKVMTIPTNQAEVVSVRNEGMDEKSVTSYFYSMVEDIVKECALMSKLQGNSNIVSYSTAARAARLHKTCRNIHQSAPQHVYPHRHLGCSAELDQLTLQSFQRPLHHFYPVPHGNLLIHQFHCLFRKVQ